MPYQQLKTYEQRFVEEYNIDLDPEAAAFRAGIPNPAKRGPALLKKEHIQIAISSAQKRRAGRTQIYADEVLRRWWLMATTDVREFQSVHRVNCRYCWGIDHRFQFRDHELAEAQAEHRFGMMRLPEHQRVPFDDRGGGGFDGEREPCRGPLWAERHGGEATSDHNCPACDGSGEPSIILKDTRDFSPGAAMLYDGVKVSKDGTLEIKLRSRDDALNKIAQHLGLVVQKRVVTTLDPTQLTDEQLDQVLQQFSHLLDNDKAQQVIDHQPLLESTTDAVEDIDDE
jgi:hypothetical protein